MTRTEETWQRLLNWAYSPETAAFLTEQVLLDQGFTHLPPDHPLADAAGADAASCELYVKDGQRWLVATHFALAQHSFEQVKSQFLEQVTALAHISVNGLVFLTNQELSRNERIALKQLCTFALLEVFDLDRIATIIDSPRLGQARQRVLYPESVPATATAGPNNAGRLPHLPIPADSTAQSGNLATRALAAAELEQLAQQDFARYAPALAASLTNLSAVHCEQGDFSAAQAASQTAVEIYDKLAQQDFDTYGANLATSLENLARSHKGQNNDATALALGQRAVSIYDRLAQNDFATYAPILARGLHNLVMYHDKPGNHEVALAMMQRAVAIREDLVRQHPTRHAVDLATSLYVLAMLTDEPGTAATLERAVRLVEPYAKPGTTYAEWLNGVPTFWRNRIAGTTNLIQLNKISLIHYRGFRQVEFAIEPDITILVANNGQGKTSVLDACRLALWPYLSGFDLAHTDSDEQFTIKPDDANFQQIAASDWAHQFPVSISIDGNYGPYADTSWGQYLDNAKPDSQIRDDDGAASLKAYARLLQWQVRNPQLPPLDLPVFAYYDTDRSWSRQRPRIGPEQAKWADAGNEFNTRTFAYRDCLKSAASYDTFEQWFAWIFTSYREAQIKNREAGLPDDAPSDWQDAIYVVRQAVNSLLKKHTGWHSLEFSLTQNALILSNDQHLTLKVTQLSDGIRNILGMVGDLAFRCIKINPHLGKQAALAARGVVLIDEIDMHLHPGWQQHVVEQLREAFPLLQFIITTHSHQVLSSVFARSIRRLHQSADGGAGDFSVEPVQYETRGVASSDVLARIMKVDEVPDVPEAEKLSQYRAMIQSGLHETEAGTELAAQLVQHFGGNHPEMLECTRLIQLEDIKRKVAAARAAKAILATGNSNA